MTKLEKLESENRLLKDRIVFEQARRMAECQHDYSLAAYMLRDLELTKSADLSTLCHLMHKEHTCLGDWRGLQDWWLEAYKKAMDTLDTN